MKFRIFIICCLLLVVSCKLAYADSLWKDGTSSPYTTAQSFKVGDIITVMVLESTSAIHKAKTDTNVQDDFGVKLAHSLDRIATLIPRSTTSDGYQKNKYGGSGKTERTSSLKSKVPVVVTEVLSNGNLRVSGKHKVSVNEDTQEILVSGIIRSKDVSITNTVYSFQVADADIKVVGTGVIQDAESPGWLTRFFNWLF